MRKYNSFHQPRRLQRGDTIIEVLLALSILGMLITITYTVMTRTMGIGYNSLDRTNTQAVLNGQANMLRAAHAAYMNAPSVDHPNTEPWVAIRELALKDTDGEATTPAAREDGCSNGVDERYAFYFDPSALDPDTATVREQLMPRIGSETGVDIEFIRDPVTNPSLTLGRGVWIEAYKITTDDEGNIQNEVYTFYIKACTPPIYGDGLDVDRQTKTVVRLYAQ